MVQSGVEQKNIEKAREEILRQLQAVQEGDFSAEDLDAAKMSVANSFRTMSDYLGGLEAWYLSQSFEKTVLTPEQSAEAVGGVTKEQMCIRDRPNGTRITRSGALLPLHRLPRPFSPF